MNKRFEVRLGTFTDASTLVDLFDESVSWLVSRGLSAQWGLAPFSDDPQRVEACHRWAASGRMYVCEVGGDVAGALVLGQAPEYVSPSREPEVYIIVLLAARRPFSQGAGSFLLKFAAHEAQMAGVERLRVDCFANSDRGGLVRYYEQEGYTRLEEFSVGEWPGQVLERRL